MCMNIGSGTDVQRDRAVQVGFVMRSYRENFVHEDGRRGLSQEELLRRMGDINTGFARRYSHATVSRWESGFTRPTVERLVVFALALDLSQSETEGLLALSGLASIVPDRGVAASSPEPYDDEPVYASDPVGSERRVLPWEIGQFLMLRVLLAAMVAFR